MERTGLIKNFTDNITIEEKTVGKAIPKHLDISFPDGKKILKISSTSNKDSITGEGAYSILIDGLDRDYKEQNEIIELKGMKSSYSIKYFLRVNNIIVLNCGRLNKNIGDIYVTSSGDTLKKGVPQKYLYHTVAKGENMSCCGVYTVPMGFSMKVKHYNTSANISYFDSITVNNYIKPPNFPPLQVSELYFDRFNSNMSYSLKDSTPFGETSDMRLTVKKHRLFKAKFGSYIQFVLIPK